MSNSICTLCVVDDHPLLRQGIVSVLKTESKFRVLAEGATTADAIALASQFRPDAILLDLDMPGDGFEALVRISAEQSGVKCIILTASTNADNALRALSSGAQGYILKGVRAAELKSAIWTVFNNQSFVSPEFATKMLMAAQNKRTKTTSTNGEILTHRELQVLGEVEAGLSNRMVGQRLKISEKTVKHYMSNIMQKFNVSNRVSAVVAFRRMRDEGAHWPS